MSNTNTPEVVTVESATASDSPKRRTRVVDYTRTNKKPHSFRYKRGSVFTPRSSSVVLSKESEGVYVIGSTPTEDTETVQCDTSSMELVKVAKRENGKTAIVFKHPTHGEILAYDARHARAMLQPLTNKK